MRLRLYYFLVFSLITTDCAFGLSDHYLDCTAGGDEADSLTPQTAWRTVAKANSYTYQPGDALLLRRGSRCEGMLSPKGSGTEEAPIHLGAYGQGVLPRISGGAQPAGLQLSNQQYWEIENLEVVGGSPYGIHIGGTAPELQHFRITNVVVHDVPGTLFTKDSGLLVIAPDADAKTRIDDVIVDGVTAYQTTEWAGIIVSGAGFDSADHQVKGEHIEIRNSIVHDVAGDGILLARVSHGVLEHNVAWYTGMQEKETIGTPNAIWEWRCSDCRVSYNEGFFSDSPGVDGGVFDIDYGDERNLLEDNFGHDSQGYCISIFGADGTSGNSVQSTIRNNSCIHNGRSPRLARRQGAIFLYTWNGGKLNGVDIADNLIVWDPPIDAPAFRSAADFTGDFPNRFAENTVIAVSGTFASSTSGLQYGENHYCRTKLPSDVSKSETSGAPRPPEPDPAANNPSPVCSCAFKPAAKRAGTSYHRAEVGTQAEIPPIVIARPGVRSVSGQWMLLASMVSTGGREAADSRSQLVLIESMMHQFADLGLKTIVVPLHSMDAEELQLWEANWNFDPAIKIDAARALEFGKEYDLRRAGQLMLISPTGRVAARWQFPVPPADVWLQIQRRLGTPKGTQQMPVCQSSAIQ